jgi:hypothetical protein
LRHMPTITVKRPGKELSLLPTKKIDVFCLLCRSLIDCELVQIHAFTLVVALKLSYSRKISFQLRNMPTRTVMRPGKE